MQGRIFIDRCGELYPEVLSLLRNGTAWAPPEDRWVRCMPKRGEGTTRGMACISHVHMNACAGVHVVGAYISNVHMNACAGVHVVGAYISHVHMNACASVHVVRGLHQSCGQGPRPWTVSVMCLTICTTIVQPLPPPPSPLTRQAALPAAGPRIHLLQHANSPAG